MEYPKRLKKKSAKAGPMLSLMQEREEGANTCWAAYESQPKATVLKVQGLSLAALGGRWWELCFGGAQESLR